MVTETAHPEPARLVRDPEWLPYTFDRSGHTLVFVHVPATLRRELPFLSAEALRTLPMARLPIDVLRRTAIALPETPLHFIFHTAACGSTLLVNAVGSTGSVTGLKEPAVFQNLVYRAAAGEDILASGRLGLVLSLLARPMAEHRQVVAKPSCFANPLLASALTASPASKAILLSAGLHSFLYAIAKRGEHGAQWARAIHAACIQLIPAAGLDKRIPSSSLEAGGLAWLMRRLHFAKIVKAFPDRTLSLDGQGLGAETPALRSALEFFGISGLPDPAVFAVHSKLNSHYREEDRRSERANLEKRFGRDVEPAVTVVERLARDVGSLV